jgi:Protein of unknown function (DUF4244)
VLRNAVVHKFDFCTFGGLAVLKTSHQTGRGGRSPGNGKRLRRSQMSGNEWSGTEDVEAAVAGGDLVLAPRVTVFARLRSDAGMTTAEYAVGTVAACGVGGVLVKVLTSESFSSLLWKVIEKAFSIIF